MIILKFCNVWKHKVGWGGILFKSKTSKIWQRLSLRGDYSAMLSCLKAQGGGGGVLLKSKILKICQRNYHSEVIVLQCCDVWKHMVGDGDTSRYNKGK